MVDFGDLKFLIKRPMLSLRRIGKFRQIMADEMVLRETFVEQAYYWLVSNLKENTVAVDIGAYKGESSIYLAMSQKVKRVIALEPMADTFEQAKKNIMRSPYKNKITLLNKAVLDRKKGGTQKLLGGARLLVRRI